MNVSGTLQQDDAQMLHLLCFQNNCFLSCFKNMCTNGAIVAGQNVVAVCFLMQNHAEEANTRYCQCRFGCLVATRLKRATALFGL